MKSFKSKIGLEIIIPLSLVFGWALFDLYSSKEWNGIAMVSVTFLFIILLINSIKYKIENTTVNIRYAFFINQNIEIITIRKIVETNNPISSPAGSLKRLEIFFNKYDSLLISPKNQLDFIDCLLKINPNIEIIYKKQKNKPINPQFL